MLVIFYGSSKLSSFALVSVCCWAVAWYRISLPHLKMIPCIKAMISGIKGKKIRHILFFAKRTEGKGRYWTLLCAQLILCGKRFCERSLDRANWKECWLGRSRWQLIGSGQAEKKCPQQVNSLSHICCCFFIGNFHMKTRFASWSLE